MNLNKTVSFEKIPAPSMTRSVVGIPFKNDFNAALGDIVPCYVQDILPATNIKMRAAAQIRLLQPFKVPMFDFCKAQFFWFYVPYRILSKYFTRFIAGSVGTDPDDTGESGASNPSDWNVDAEGGLMIPKIVTNGIEGLRGDLIQPRTIWDYMNMAGGVPKAASRTNQDYYYVNQGMIVRAYNCIFNWFFRDENLETAKSIDYGSATTEATNYQILKAAKTRDMYTTALIKPQKSNPVEVDIVSGGQAPLSAVNVPVTGNIDIYSSGSPFELDYGNISSGSENTSLNSTLFTDFGSGHKKGSPFPNDGTPANVGSYSGGLTGSLGDAKASLAGVYANLEGVTGSISLQHLRLLAQVNKWTERLAIGGSRYGEVIQSFFGVNPGDKRLQQPQFLGVGTVDINVQEVVQTYGQGEDLGATGGRSNSIAGAGSWFQSFPEHGVLLCLMVIRQKMNTYQQGQPRMYDKSTRLDLYWPTFSHIGFQPIKNRTIYLEPDNKTGNKNEDVFGYNRPWIEYLQKPNEVHGDLLSNSGDTPLDFWNLSERFDSLPTLGSTFIKAHQNNLNRALLGEQSMDAPFVVNFRTEAYYTIPVPINAQPGYMDHF